MRAVNAPFLLFPSAKEAVSSRLASVQFKESMPWLQTVNILALTDLSSDVLEKLAKPTRLIQSSCLFAIKVVHGRVPEPGASVSASPAGTYEKLTSTARMQSCSRPMMTPIDSVLTKSVQQSYETSTAYRTNKIRNPYLKDYHIHNNEHESNQSNHVGGQPCW